jgi:hypothetical protein
LSSVSSGKPQLWQSGVSMARYGSARFTRPSID